MEIRNFTYLFLLIAVAVAELIVLLKTRVRHQIQLKYVFPALLITGSMLIICEIRFASYGIKNFNSDYVTGINIQNLPIEAWIYYLIFSFGAILIYETSKLKWEYYEKPNLFVIISLGVIVVLALVVWFFRAKSYAFFTFFLTLIYFGYIIFRNRFKNRLAKFYITFFIAFVPFLIFEIILTSIPVVSYDLQTRIGTEFLHVPVENIVFFFLLLIMNITIYEFFCERRLF